MRRKLQQNDNKVLETHRRGETKQKHTHILIHHTFKRVLVFWSRGKTITFSYIYIYVHIIFTKTTKLSDFREICVRKKERKKRAST